MAAGNVFSNINSLDDDTLHRITKFVGEPCYSVVGAISKRCNRLYDTYNLAKKTSWFRHATLSAIQQRNVPYYGGHGDRTVVGKSVAIYNREDVLNWAISERNSDALRSIGAAASREGRVDILRKIRERLDNSLDFFEREEFYLHATTHDSLETLEYFKEECGSIHMSHSAIFNWAARDRENNFEVLGWIKRNIMDFHPQVCASAAEGGNIENLKWLKRNGCPLDEEAFESAAGFGHHNVCVWLRNNNCPWSKETTLAARSGCHDDILEWLVQNGCPQHTPEELRLIAEEYDDDFDDDFDMESMEGIQ
uniref:F-box domain-containing protein n=1 Tax=Sundstroemia setigera TaxID=3005 RepID=A0A7S0A1N9_9STRA|mmetsp:Transcript_463/g.558  ORF Transcript_463/g.558 Transcript_463/m.558 type:complete len:308 (+) Transcript_463:431-1354(+)|eukprot:CAMPEP_0178943258 /NCGR_PEP_ID=MMETSP0789-20121207/2482_1 /TAXON_ID=3005 /ORGANISM="Rhizosolenia setigera, Strain CCMP 1694" /LENGTH=307 /DNA_ID=CAMNT_0020622823 /DNA_START=685 /DNA_END=1608 /DNA_ORIENTATION=-